MFTVTIKPEDGDSFEVPLCEMEEEFKRLTIQDLWTKIREESKNENYKSGKYCLNFGDRTFQSEHDSFLLTEVGIKNQSVIHLDGIPIFHSGNIPHTDDERKSLTSSEDIKRTWSMDRLADFDSSDQHVTDESGHFYVILE